MNSISFIVFTLGMVYFSQVGQVPAYYIVGYFIYVALAVADQFGLFD